MRQSELTNQEVLFGLSFVDRIAMRLYGIAGSQGRFVLKTSFSQDVLLALVDAEVLQVVSSGECPTDDSGKSFPNQNTKIAFIRLCARDALELAQPVEERRQETGSGAKLDLAKFRGR